MVLIGCFSQLSNPRVIETIGCRHAEPFTLSCENHRSKCAFAAFAAFAFFSPNSVSTLGGSYGIGVKAGA